MRLYIALIQCSLFISLSLFIYNCHGHEHPNHIDPVPTKYSGSAGTVDPLTKPIETANVPKTDFQQQHNEDEHVHDTIEARLQAKHTLRQSVHQHTDDDDKHQIEQEYINQLNLALENDSKSEHQFQYAVPPIEESVNHTSSENQTKENEPVPLLVQNETISATSTSIQTPPEKQQPIREELSSTEAPKIIDTSTKVPVVDEKSNSKVISEEIVPPGGVQTNEQQLKDPIQQNIVKEDVLLIHKETVSATQSQQQEATLNIAKSATDPTPSSSDQKQPVPETLKNDSTVDVKHSSSTPLQAPEVTQTDDLSNSSLEQQKTSVPVQNASSSDVKTDQQQPTPEPIKANHSLDLNLEQPKTTSDTVQNNSSLEQNSSPSTPIKSDQEQEKLVSETIKDTSSIDHNTLLAEEYQQPPVIDTPEPTETVSSNVKLDEDLSVPKEIPTVIHKSTPPPPTTTTTTRVLRSATSRIQQAAQTRHRHAHTKPQEPKPTSTIETTTTVPTIEKSIEENDQSIESSSTLQPEQPRVETLQTLPLDLNIDNETETQVNDQIIEPIGVTDLPRQVHVHDPRTTLNELQEEIDKNENENENPSLDEQIENSATVDSFLVKDHSPHLPRILENEEIVIDSTTNTPQTIETTTNEAYSNPVQNDSNIEETNNSLTYKSNISDTISPDQYRQVCWRLPKPFEPSLGLIENQLLRFINLFPEFLQTTLFGRIDDRETLMNTIWFGSICTMCFLFSLIFLSLGAKRLKQSKREKEVRARCQQLQQYNNQIELERATFERQNQKLSDEIDELKNLPVRDADEEIFELRERYEQLHADWKITRSEHDALQREIDHKQSLMQKHEFEMQKQVETVAYLNNEILRQKQELEKEREKIARVQSNDLSLERFEKLQEIIHELKSEITQLKQDKFAQTDQLQQVQDHANQLDIDNNELTIKMKQLKDLLEQRDETIARIREKMLDDNDDEEKTTEIGDILSTVTENNSDNSQQQQLLSTIDNDVEKANQHMRDLHTEIEEKARRVKELDALLNQEKDRCRELETKLKVVLELRERDAHLHIRQLGQTDAELRKARTDTERVRILQQQLELKQQQLDDVQKVLASEQTKSSEECSKLQHETHEKWMEVKRLTRELDSARKECEGLRRQITKYAHNDRSSLEKTMHKPVPQHLNNTGRLSSEPETNGSSPPTLPYQQGDNFRPIDHERNDSGAASPSEMFRIRPPLFGLARPPFFPPPFMHPPPHNPFMMAPRFPMPVGGPHGMISPIPHLMTNGSGGGSDTNSFEIVDSTNITPNSTSYDVQLNGSAVSPTPDDDQHATTKPKKPKKSLKKKTKTSTTATVSSTKEDV